MKPLHLSPGMDTDADQRLAEFEGRMRNATRRAPDLRGNTNNHIHTVYSYSPYTPSDAVLAAWQAGLQVAGLVDHESVAGCDEMLKAGMMAGMAITTGCELRVNTLGTALEGRRLNNPDSTGQFYTVLHGIPHQNRHVVDRFLEPLRRSRFGRMQQETGELNRLLETWKFPTVDFRTDVLPLTLYGRGGTVTERHILHALALNLVAAFGTGRGLKSALSGVMDIDGYFGRDAEVPGEGDSFLIDDLVGLFRKTLVPKFYREPDTVECPGVLEVLALARQVGALAAYPYLGDDVSAAGVSGQSGQSGFPGGVDGQRAELFEDSWLDELFDILVSLGFRAVTLMPPRNSARQIMRIRGLCRKHDCMPISGVDINSARQDFRCPDMDAEVSAELNSSTWALVAHEHLSSRGGSGLLDSGSPVAHLALRERIELYARVGQAMDPREPGSILRAAREGGLWTG